MLTLAELQHALQDFLLDNTADAEQLTLDTPQFSRRERLQIYHSAYRLRLVEALRNDYSAVAQTLGEESFVKMCAEFIATYPSQHSSLRWLGKKLPAFLREQQYKTHICELAEFEWAQTMAFDAADASLATAENLRLLTPEAWMSLQLEFHPSVQLLRFHSNAPALWNRCIKEPDSAASEIVTAIEPQAWLVWRQELQVLYRALDASEAEALGAFLAHQHFAEVCSGLCDWFAEEEVPMQAARYLQQWLQAGLITSAG